MQRNNPLRLALAVAMLMKVSPTALAKAVKTKNLKEYASKVVAALDKDISKGYADAVKALSKTK